MNTIIDELDWINFKPPYVEFGGREAFIKLKETPLYKLAGEDPYEVRWVKYGSMVVTSVDKVNGIVSIGNQE